MRPQHDSADQQADQPGGDRSQQQRGGKRRIGVLDRQRDRVGAKSEKCGMSKRNDAAQAHSEMQAGSEQRSDRDLRSDHDRIVTDQRR